MKFIDEKGRLFGKINVIDFIVLLVLVAAIAVVGIRFMGNGEVVTEEEDTLIVKFYAEEVSNFVTDKVKKGDALYDDVNCKYLGKVSEVELGEAEIYNVTSDGKFVSATKENHSSILITSEVKGKKTDIGAEIDKIKYGVGHSMVLRAGDAKIYLRVYDIAVKEG